MDVPAAELDPKFSSPDATATSWEKATDTLQGAKTYWLTTVRPDRRPHVTTIAGVWLDGSFHFVTGESERKARNIAAGNDHVVVTTGCNGWDGLDVVLEGEAVRVTDVERLRRLVDAFADKYDDFFALRLDGGQLTTEGASGRTFAFEVQARKAFGFGKGDTFSQTRWRFAEAR